MKITALIIGLTALLSTSCTDNARAKTFGGTAKVEIPKGSKLVTATWKDGQIWYLYRPMRDGETPETSTFQEKSSMGMVEGKVLFIESK